MKSNKTDLDSFFKSISTRFYKEDQVVIDPSILEEIQTKPGECYFVFDLMQNKISHSTGIESVLGYSEKKVSLGFLTTLLHPEDTDLVQMIISNSIIQIIGKEIPKYKNVFKISSRMRNSDGNYIKILSENFIFNTNLNNQIQSFLIRYTDVSFLDQSKVIDWWVNEEFVDKKEISDSIFGEEKNIFTEREKEIILLMISENSTKQISKILNVSHHTVSTHRKNIFHKSKCSGIEALRNYCKENGVFSKE